MLLASKKLTLLIDLDQTLIHTTNREPRASELAKVCLRFFTFKIAKIVRAFRAFTRFNFIPAFIIRAFDHIQASSSKISTNFSSATS